ncbi:gamma-glutamyltransferase [Salisediminibacterium beveridgei]|uniref:Gammaglutamyl transpeptidase n=1 Tax=Salisediminibacterium beveridgei TaxID=632773 RepID=A0A1D7QRR5_9BACI|nr:gamma-glutamyltransferase [Salisediminibacterium beveridgei]AOM81703.1 gammaglutamyl transpeptidase [Salisediminibacterium beveridgei]
MKQLKQLSSLLFLPMTVALLATGCSDEEVEDKEPDQDAPDDSVVGSGGAVATEDVHASDAGMTILEEGGNAVDAAIASAAAQGVTRPFSGGIGGGGMMMIYLAEEDQHVVIDHRSQATEVFGPDSLRREAGDLIYPEETRISGSAVTAVPGAVKAWAEALDTYGTMNLSEVLQPAIAIAEEGFQVDETFVRELRENAERFRLFEPTTDLYLGDDGELPEAEKVFTNPDLGETYRLIGEHGSDVFYEGEIGQAITETVNEPPVVADPDFDAVSESWEEEYGILKGAMTMADLAAYKPITREPVHSTYQGYDIYGAPPSSSGGLTISHALNILEGVDLTSMPREEAFHYYLEASRLAFADRRAYIGDPAMTAISTEGFLSKAYADKRRTLIQEDVAMTGQIGPGDPAGFDDEAAESSPALAYDFTEDDGDKWALTAFHRLDRGPMNSPFDAELDIKDDTGRLAIAKRNPERGSAYGRAAGNMAATANSELTIRFKTDSVGDNQRLRFWLQGDVWNSGSTAPENGYGVEVNLETEELVLLLAQDSALKTLDTMGIKMDTAWKDLRFRVDGNDLQASLWDVDEAEPGDWAIDHTLESDELLDDRRGRFLLSGINFTQQNDVTFQIDRVTVEDLGTSGGEEVKESSPSEGSPVVTDDAHRLSEDKGEGESTIHLSVSDEAGNIVSYTSTIVSIGGNGMVVPERGFLLNNALYDRTPWQHPTHPNYPRPGMRPMSSMAPTLILQNGAPVMTLGAPGSDSILTTVLQIVLNRLAFDMPLDEAIADPRINQRNPFSGAGRYEAIFHQVDTGLPDLVGALEAKGHQFRPATATQGIGAVTGIEFLPNGKVMPATEKVRRGGGHAQVQSEDEAGDP